jgi:hypothetical protein
MTELSLIHDSGQHPRSPRNLSQLTVEVVDIYCRKTSTLEHLRAGLAQGDGADWSKVANYPTFENGNWCAIVNQEVIENVAICPSEEFWLAHIEHCHEERKSFSPVASGDKETLSGTFDNQHTPRRCRAVVSKNLKVAVPEVRLDKRRIGDNRYGPLWWPRRVDRQYCGRIQELKTQPPIEFNNVAARRQVSEGVVRLLQNGSHQPDSMTSIALNDTKGTHIADALNHTADLPLGVEGDVRPDDLVVVDQHIAVIGCVLHPMRVDSGGPRPGRDSLIQVLVQEVRDKMDVVVLDRTKHDRRMGHMSRLGYFIPADEEPRAAVSSVRPTRVELAMDFTK